MKLKNINKLKNSADYNIFSSKIAKRILMQFILCALIPVIFFSLFSNYTVTQQLKLQTYEELHQSIKNYGLSIYQRLEIIQIQLEQLKHIIKANSADATRALVDNAELLKSYNDSIKKITLVSHNKPFTLTGEDIVIKKNMMNPQFNHLKMIIVVDYDLNKDTIVYALYKINSFAYLIAEINPDYLWNAKIISPYDLDYCIMSKEFQPIHCPAGFDKSLAGPIKSNLMNKAQGHFELTQGSTQKLFSFWSLFLKGTFDAESWVFIIHRNGADILKPISNFAFYLILTTILAICIVFFLSITQIRRVLNPLKKLQEGTKAIARKDFDKKIFIQSKDEFEELAQSFNQMADKLNMQFYTLETLATIDRLILSSLNIEKIVDTLLTQLKLIISQHMVSILINDTDNPKGVCLFYLDDKNEQKKLLFNLSDAEQELLAQNESLVLNNSFNNEHFQEVLLLKEGQHILFPFYHAKKLMGAIILTKAENIEISEEELKQINGLKARIAVALSNASWEDKLFHQAHYDSLTNLPNRLLFHERLEQAIQRAQRNHSFVALFFLDVDRFKVVNDSLGHDKGDELLKEISSRIQSVIRDTDTASRIGGDEFTVIIPDINSNTRVLQHVSNVAQKLLKVLSLPIQSDTLNILNLTASIGISIYPNDGSNLLNLIQNADIAMYHAKSLGRNNFQYYSKALNKKLAKKLQVETQIKEALLNDSFVLLYQPQYDLITNSFCGCEALIRLNQNGTLISPAEFIALAEESSLIISIGEQVISKACQQLNLWKHMGYAIKVSINVSPQQIQSANLVPHLIQMTEYYEINPQYLVLEITKSLMSIDIDFMTRKLKELNALGFSIAMDDFGTGYSSLSFTHLLPLTYLKIDQSFIKNLDHDLQFFHITKAIIYMAHCLDLVVIAEGIEKQQHIDILIQLGCDIGQGYFFSEPITPEALFTIFDKRDHNSKKINLS